MKGVEEGIVVEAGIATRGRRGVIVSMARVSHESESRRRAAHPMATVRAANRAIVRGAAEAVGRAGERGCGRTPPHRTAEWTDRTLGTYPGRAVCCVWELGARGIGARAARTDG